MNKKKRFIQKSVSFFMAAVMIFTSLAPGITNIAFAADNSSAIIVDAGDAVQADYTSDIVEEDTSNEDKELDEGEKSDDFETPDNRENDKVENSDTTPDDEKKEGEVDGEITDSNETDPSETEGKEDEDSIVNGEEPGDDIDPDADGEDEEGEGSGDDVIDFIPLVVLDPENGESTIVAEIGDEVTFSFGLSRDDVAVKLQWQRLQSHVPTENVAEVKPIFIYDENAPTWYSFPFEGINESQVLESNSEAAWQGIETYIAVVNAIKEIGENTDGVSLAWKTPNFALNGYAITAEKTANGIRLFAEKDDEIYVGTLNSEGKFEFTDEAQSASSIFVENEWVDIEGANDTSYTFTVTKADHYAVYRLQVTIIDEDYLAESAKMWRDVELELSEEELSEPQNLYSVLMNVESVNKDSSKAIVVMSTSEGFNNLIATLAREPYITEDVQWVAGINSNYEYITKDTYDRITAWYNAGQITKEQYDMYWTKLQPKGWSGTATANVLDKNGFPTGETRLYRGFTLTGDRLEIASEWYGKTVYFRVAGTEGWKALDIPAYTEVSGNGNKYDEAASGTKYKTAVTMLNAYVPDVGPIYKSFLDVMTSGGWLKNRSGDDDFGGATMNIHIQMYTVSINVFNADPQQYMVDAEGNFRMDSFAWGVCCYDEPDMSGKTYWLIKDYLSNGYGMLIGHDTIYGYAGSYYDAYGIDLDESTIDPNDGETWYYNIRTWTPTARSADGTKTNPNRGGHFYMNQLFGSNAGNVLKKNTIPSDAQLWILSAGGLYGGLGIPGMYGNTSVQIKQTGYTHALAKVNPRYRTPTNYPYEFSDNQVVRTSFTHTNMQAAFGTIWADYYGGNLGTSAWGGEPTPRVWEINGRKGTNNFYITTVGNALMNQIGHLPENTATGDESALLANSIMWISQRKQCEICDANQDGQQTVHFVRRISGANFKEVTDALRDGGTFWYPIDGCYQLTEDIVLPEDWTPISGFKGHWNSDVYEVTLNSKGTPLLKNDVQDGESGWNLGTDKSKGTENVFNSEMTRTTGVARVLGDLNDLFGTYGKSYAGYTLVFYGYENERYMEPDEVYSITINPDSKYVVSNLPCVYDEVEGGTMRARVYKPDGTEVVEYGVIRADVPKSFWDTDMTTTLYLGNFDADPVNNYTTYEHGQAYFTAKGYSFDDFDLLRWEYTDGGVDQWKEVPQSWNITVESTKTPPETSADDYVIETKLTLNDVNPNWYGYQFRRVFTSELHGEWNTYVYYWLGSSASNDPVAGWNRADVAETGYMGILFVESWPTFAQQSENHTVNEGGSANFEAYGIAMDTGSPISVRWQYSTLAYTVNGKEVYDWHYIDEDDEFSDTVVITDAPQTITLNEFDAELNSITAAENDLDKFHQYGVIHSVRTSLDVNKFDITQNGTHFRAEFKASTSHGTEYTWYSSIADDSYGAYNTNSGDFSTFIKTIQPDFSNKITIIPPDLDLITSKSVDFYEGSLNQDLMTPDAYGQTILKSLDNDSTDNNTAVYRATIYYRPFDMQPDIIWQYMTYNERVAKEWNQDVAESLGYAGVTVNFELTDPEEVEYNGEDGWMKIISTMTIGNIPEQMYNPERMLKYYFRCVATTSYETVKADKALAATDKWGGLTMDYQVDVRHNGVMEYGNTNNINNEVVTTPSGIQESTDQREFSDWYYPNLAINIPSGHHINTVMVFFDDEVGYDENDILLFDESSINALGVEIKEHTDKSMILVSSAVNTVEREAWEQILREYVGFRAYDSVDFDFEKIISGTTEGAGIKWIVDEARLADVTIDPETGHAYKLVTWDEPIDWESAKQRAQTYDDELQMSGNLVEISDEAEYELVKTIVGENEAWIGGYYKDGNYLWASNNELVDFLPWSDDPDLQKDNANLYIREDGGYGSAPILLKRAFDTSATITGSWSTTSTNRNAAHTAWIDLPEPSYKVVVKGTSSTNDTTGDCFIQVQNRKVNGATEYTNWSQARYNTSFTWTINAPANNPINGVRGYALQNAAAYSYYTVTIRVTSVQYFYKADAVYRDNTIKSAVIEYVPQSLSMVVSDHSGYDDAIIGTNAKTPEDITGEIAARIVGASKIYDGTQIYPSQFIVSGATGADRSLFNITYTATVPDNHANYKTTTVNGNDYNRTGAINATTYHAVLSLTDEAVAAGWVLDEQLSQLECDLIIYQRPVHVYSYHNEKDYDGTSVGSINNLKFMPADEVSGVVAGDNVRLNLTSVQGSYTDGNGNSVIHNSKYNNNDEEYVMRRNTAISPLDILHNETSDPHYNYVLGLEDYTGPINPKGLYIHSLYLEDPEYARNIKGYDGKADATVKDIIIDGVFEGDNITLNKESYSGQYATKNAGEELTPEGTLQNDRYLKLAENKINLTENVELIGNDYNDYFIDKEEYSGAIYRAMLEVRVKSNRYMYGTEGPGEPTYEDSYDSNTQGDTWMNVHGLIPGDILELDENFDLEVKDKNGEVHDVTFDNRTDVGNYPVSPEGMTEENYPVLENYFFNTTNGNVEVYPREIVVTAGNIDRYVEDHSIPTIFSSFEMLEDDEVSLKYVGNDGEDRYADMALIGDDTVGNTITVNGRKIGLNEEGNMYVATTNILGIRTIFHNNSNIPYATAWYDDAPAQYVISEKDLTLTPCEWCQEYHGFTIGTEHIPVVGYRLEVNQNVTMGDVLEVAEVENVMGEMVKNYTLKFVDGEIRVHPKLRFKLEATVPIAVCMYGYAGDGEVVEPENYGITNYSNLPIKVIDIDVSDDIDSWYIVDKAPLDLVRGEMSMKMLDTQLVTGHNTPSVKENWVIAADEEQQHEGVFLHLPLHCYIAGGNVNERTEQYITHITYTVAEASDLVDTSIEYIG